MTELSKKTTWTGRENGVGFEIAFWGEGSMCDGHGMWNYYIDIPELALSEDDFRRVWLEPSACHERSNGAAWPTYDEYNSILNVDSWHGGITAYYKRGGIDGAPRYVRVGCDYGHLWDRERGYGYTLDKIERDARQTVRDIQKVLRFKTACAYTGVYDYPENMIERDGRLYTAAGLAKRDAWTAENVSA